MFSVNPYLNFVDECEAAFTFYKSVFGGDFAMMQRFSDVPESEEMPVAEADKNKIMHCSLPIGKGCVLMGSDMPEAMKDQYIKGNNNAISLHPENVEEGQKLFDALSEGGQVAMPFEKQFWNAHYGAFMDKFGIHWMVNVDLGEQS